MAEIITNHDEMIQSAKGQNESSDDHSVKTLVIGGCRSGKSKFALEQALLFAPCRVFVATLEKKGDAEMDQRIKFHLESRAQDWITVEEPIRIVELLLDRQQETDVFLVDCLTMWITNYIMRGVSDLDIEKEVRGLQKVVADMSTPVIFVANEVGLGIVPETSLGRRFRDLAGWTNQQMAQVCNKVVFVTAGLPMYLKK